MRKKWSEKKEKERKNNELDLVQKNKKSYKHIVTSSFALQGFTFKAFIRIMKYDTLLEFTLPNSICSTQTSYNIKIKLAGECINNLRLKETILQREIV